MSESATYISSFNTSIPADDSTKCAADFVAIKTAIKQTFPNVTSAVLATHVNLNLAHYGGTVSGSMHVKGDVSASSAYISRLPSLASATLTGQIGLNVNDRSIVFSGTRLRNDFVCVFNTSEITISASSSLTIMHSNQATSLFSAVGRTDWVSTSSDLSIKVIVDPGIYQFDIQYGILCATSLSGSMTFNLLKNGNAEIAKTHCQARSINLVNYTKSARYIDEITGTTSLKSVLTLRGTGGQPKIANYVFKARRFQ